MTELRARNRSSSTIEQALRSVMLLYMTLDHLGVDLDERLSQGRILDLGEIEEVALSCRSSLDSLRPANVRSEVSRERVGTLEGLRMRAGPMSQEAAVDPATAAIRMSYIRSYLIWRATDQLLKWGPTHVSHAGLLNVSKLVSNAIGERTLSPRGRNALRQREGMSAEPLARLIAVIDPTSPANPWTGLHARERNALMLRWFLSLGVRRGELLGVRISDINFQSHEVLIARRADTPDDPRKFQPNTKTNDRLLSLDDDLAYQTRQYIIGPRRAARGARQHEYLFVANGSGAPLTLDALNKVFVGLRKKCLDLPSNLTPHMLRHTWNDLFSALMDKQKVPEETEKRMRSRLMGWAPTSTTAETYTRRHVRRRADVVLLEMQKALRTGEAHGPQEDSSSSRD
ncbi:tyrosine-type recombinase/integrase [Variovorax sp. PAMC26660]|uniref:tyrosine-type recombinase/integrase n=1 Tax=Variovorax sp. PAMC26660 TaxID=2762322 RepID=UPI00164DE7DA|nr:tyrosine-type recombinase/integrase [Variovorax sp. PAMC26660]QNK70755.1 tyrosine-type recombinase/integrase [Variovorax sp. PAMC26660]